MSHRARKRFGQNFLHDSGVIQKIIQAIAPQASDSMVEIGPGLGALTLPLLKTCGRLQVVELDRDLIPKLQSQARGMGELEVHQADALRFNFCSLQQDRPLRVVGNLPYNISTPLLFHLLSQADCILDMHFMLQKEVVQRMAAPPGSRDYGRLSVALALQAQCEPLFVVGSGAFNPAPKVDSAVVRITPLPSDQRGFNPTVNKVLSTAFSARRKTLSNALKTLLSREQIQGCDIDPGLRPEQISPQGFQRLAAAVDTVETSA